MTSNYYALQLAKATFLHLDKGKRIWVGAYVAVDNIGKLVAYAKQQMRPIERHSGELLQADKKMHPTGTPEGQREGARKRRDDEID